jgi:plastocyanin
MRGFRLMGVMAVAGAMMVAGCGSDDSSDSGGSGGGGSASGGSTSESSSGGGAAGTVSISETEFKLDPADAKVDKAGKVTFKVTNDGQITHALEVEGPGEEAKTGAIQPGKSATLSVDLSKAGTYEMYCPIGNHKQQGMEGKIAVAGGGSGGSSDDKGGEDEDSGGGSGY